MEYEIVELKARTVVGMGIRTRNDAPDMAQKIGGVWAAFLGGERAKVNSAPDAPCLGLYTNYDWADVSYDMLAATQGETCPEGFRRVEIPAGKYAKFTFHGDVQKATAEAWGRIWAEPLPRACQVDFEEYGQPGPDGQADISIYVGLADVCQSCGMPMTEEAQRGTEKDGSKSAEYCCYCRKNGAFTADCTMEEMIDFCLDTEEGKKLYTDRELARSQMLAYYPTLKRWKDQAKK